MRRWLPSLLLLMFISCALHAASIPTGAVGVQIAAPADPLHVAKYDKLELLVSLTTSATNNFNPDPTTGVDLNATFTAPDASTTKVNGFYDGSSWRVRFAPTQLGNWTFTVSATDSGGTATWTGGSFTCVASSSPGFAKIDGTYLRFSEGQAMFAIGHNNGWLYDVEQPSFSSMAAQGENLLSFWLNSPWKTPGEAEPRCPIENVTQGIGVYNQPACAYLDGVVARAESAGVYLLPSIWSHGNLRYYNTVSDPQNHPWGQGWWSNNAYSAICSAADFFNTGGGTDTAQWKYQKNYYRYLIARYGYSRAIIGWVAVVEIEGTTGYGVSGQPAGYANAAQARTWCAAVRNYFAANDPFRLSSSSKYPISVSQTDYYNTETTWASGCDMSAADSYTKQTDATAVATAIANEIGGGGGVTAMRASGRPSFMAEFGASEPNSNYNTYQPKHFHNGLWAGTAAGSCLAPLLWCDEGNFPMLTDANIGTQLRAQLQHLQEFTSSIVYIDAPSFAPLTVSVGSGFNARGMGLADRGFGWIQNTAGNVGGQTLTVSGLTAGKYNVFWYDTWTSGSTPLSLQPQVITVTGTGVLTATVPTPGTARADLAFKFFLNAAPTIAVAATASPSPVIGTTTTLSVLGADDTSEAYLTYQWAVVGTPPAAPVIAINNSNVAKSTGVTFSKIGSYGFKVTITDTAGATVSSGTVTVQVNATPTSIIVSPASTTVPLNGSANFTAQVFDQFGAATSATVGYAVSGGGSIDAAGLFTAGAIEGGPFTITASAGSASGTATVGIINAAPSISATTANPTTVSGTSTALSVTATDDGGEAGLCYTWAVTAAPPGGTAVFSLNGSNGAKNSTATFTKAGAYTFSVVAADGGGLNASSTVSVTVSQTATTVLVAPATVSIAEFSTQQYTASIADQFGAAIVATPAWSVTGGGSINGAGLYTAGLAGGATVKATSGAASGSASVTIVHINTAPVISAASATPATVSGTTSALSVTATDDGGEAGLTYAWSVVSAPNGATVNFTPNGTNAAKNASALFSAPGNYQLSVSAVDSAALSDSKTVNVTVQQTLTSIDVSPASPVVVSNGTQLFTATPRDQYGSPMVAPLIWSVSGGGSIDQSGNLNAQTAAGSFTVNATSGAIVGSTNFTVSNTAPVIAAVTATPDTVAGATTNLQATASDDGGEANLTYAWSLTSAPSGGSASFSATGSHAAQNSTATFTKSGNYLLNVTVTDGAGLASSSSVGVTVAQTPTVITVAPGSVVLEPNVTQNFSATVTDQFGSVFSPVLTWSVDAGGSIDSSGVFTAGAAQGGPFTVSAAAGSATGTASVSLQHTNTAPVIGAVAANPTTVTGTTSALSVTASDDGGEAGLAYTWAVTSAPSGGSASFNLNGSNAAKNATATFTKAGTYGFSVTATDGGNLTAVGTVSVTVTQTASAVVVTPANVSLNENATQQYAASITDQFGATLIATPTWSATGNGSVNASGLFTSGLAGAASVKATSGAASGTASVTVVHLNTAPVIGAVAANPTTVTGTTSALSVTASDDGGEAGLSYTWAVTSTPSGGSATFSFNGTNAAKNATATFTKAGTYGFSVTAMDGGSLSAVGSVSVTVTQTASAVVVTPANVSLNENATQQYAASITDQFGATLIATPTWSATGNGSVNASGFFTAGLAGAASVKATSGGANGTASVTIVHLNTPPVIGAVNVGANPVSGTNTTLSATASDDAGEPLLIYTWSVTSAPPGGSASFSANGTNAAKNAVVTFTTAGAYTFGLTVKDGGGLSGIGSVSTTVNATLGAMSMSPTSAMLPVNGSMQFSATVTDQFQKSMSVAWAATGGTVSPTGIYTADTTPGTYAVTISAGGSSQNATVTVAQGTLTATLATPATSTNLATEGTTDWAHWGTTTALSYDHKANVTPQISTFAKVGNGTVTRVTTGATATWTGGTPTAKGSGKTGLLTTGVNNGYSITVPATSAVQRLNVYVGVYKAKGKLTATLSDGSAVSYVDTSVTTASGTLNRVYSFQFAAVNPGATLTVTWTMVSGSSGGGVTLQSATLGSGALTGAKIAGVTGSKKK